MALQQTNQGFLGNIETENTDVTSAGTENIDESINEKD